jgi:hypothetical protein
MTTTQDLTRDVVNAALKSLPVHLQKPGLQVDLGGNTETGKAPPPCTGRDCTPPCKGFGCATTIIGHDPLLFVALALVIGLVIGFLFGSRRNR